MPIAKANAPAAGGLFGIGLSGNENQKRKLIALQRIERRPGAAGDGAAFRMGRVGDSSLPDER